MLEIIINMVFAIIVIGTAYLTGYVIGIDEALDMIEEPEDERHLHCFECEIDMPVKEKNGDFYCSNCGLYRGTKI